MALEENFVKWAPRLPILLVLFGTMFLTLTTRWHLISIKRTSLDGDTWDDSLAGNTTRYRVLTPASETGGEYFTVEVTMQPQTPGFYAEQSGSLPQHWLPDVDKTVVVKAGFLGYRINATHHVVGDVHRLAREGDTVYIPAGARHVLFNPANSTSLVLEVTHAPAGPMGEAFYANLAALGRDYKALERVHPMQIMVLFDEAGAKLDLFPKADILNKVALEWGFAPLARAMGFRATYPEYRGKAKPAAS